MESNLRAADKDRQKVIDALQQHTAEGRLSLDEFTERVDAVHRARTYGELAVVTADLPTPVARRWASRSGVLTTVVITVALLVVLLGAAGLAWLGGWGMDAMMASMTTAMGNGCG